MDQQSVSSYVSAASSSSSASYYTLPESGPILPVRERLMKAYGLSGGSDNRAKDDGAIPTDTVIKIRQAKELQKINSAPTFMSAVDILAKLEPKTVNVNDDPYTIVKKCFNDLPSKENTMRISDTNRVKISKAILTGNLYACDLPLLNKPLKHHQPSFADSAEKAFEVGIEHRDTANNKPFFTVRSTPAPIHNLTLTSSTSKHSGLSTPSQSTLIYTTTPHGSYIVNDDGVDIDQIIAAAELASIQGGGASVDSNGMPKPKKPPLQIVMPQPTKSRTGQMNASSQTDDEEQRKCFEDLENSANEAFSSHKWRSRDKRPPSEDLIKASSIAASVEQAKKKQLTRNRLEVSLYKSLLESRKRAEAIENEGRLDGKKAVIAFRQKLMESLKEKEGLAGYDGAIMRYFDEEKALEFMQKYKGFSLSTDAIFMLIGRFIGGHDSDDSVDYLDRFGPNPEVVMAQKQQHARQLRQKEVDLSSSKFKHGPVLTPLPLSRDGGVRGGGDGRRNGRLDKSLEFDGSDSPESRKLRKAKSSFGGGFHIPDKAKKEFDKVPDAATEMMKPFLDAAMRRSKDANASDNAGTEGGTVVSGGGKGGLINQEADDVEDKGSSISAENKTIRSNMSSSPKKPQAKSSSSSSSSSSNNNNDDGDGEMDSRILAAIHAMNNQLLLEDLLPSRHPEKVLSDDQLERLGKGQVDFENIFLAKKRMEKFNNTSMNTSMNNIDLNNTLRRSTSFSSTMSNNNVSANIPANSIHVDDTAVDGGGKDASIGVSYRAHPKSLSGKSNSDHTKASDVETFLTDAKTDNSNANIASESKGVVVLLSPAKEAVRPETRITSQSVGRGNSNPFKGSDEPFSPDLIPIVEGSITPQATDNLPYQQPSSSINSQVHPTTISSKTSSGGGGGADGEVKLKLVVAERGSNNGSKGLGTMSAVVGKSSVGGSVTGNQVHTLQHSFSASGEQLHQSFGSSNKLSLQRSNTSMHAVVQRVNPRGKTITPMALARISHQSKVGMELPAISPYAEPIGAVSEKTIISASGVPAGAGQALWTGKRVIPRQKLSKNKSAI